MCSSHSVLRIGLGLHVEYGGYVAPLSSPFPYAENLAVLLPILPLPSAVHMA